MIVLLLGLVAVLLVLVLVAIARVHGVLTDTAEMVGEQSMGLIDLWADVAKRT